MRLLRIIFYLPYALIKISRIIYVLSNYYGGLVILWEFFKHAHGDNCRKCKAELERNTREILRVDFPSENLGHICNLALWSIILTLWYVS